MDFSTRTDVDVPIGHVFDRLSDFAGFEKSALRRGSEVSRIDGLTRIGPGARWRVLFDYAGKRRRVDLTLEEYDQADHMRFGLSSRHASGHIAVNLLVLTPGRTRVLIKIRLRPLTVPGRLLLQAIRMTKARAVKRLGRRVDRYAREIERTYGQVQAGGATPPTPQCRPGSAG